VIGRRRVNSTGYAPIVLDSSNVKELRGAGERALRDAEIKSKMNEPASEDEDRNKS
jgi:hypothetical protein